MSDSQLQQGIAAAKAGDSKRATAILLQVVRRDMDNPLAWLWLAQVIEGKKRKRDCLKQVLRIEPGNNVARQMLASLEEPPAVKPPAPQPEPRPEPQPVAPAPTPEPQLELEPAPEPTPQRVSLFDRARSIQSFPRRSELFPSGEPEPSAAEPEPEEEDEEEAEESFPVPTVSYGAARRMQWINLRTIFGLLGLIDLPIVAVLLLLLLRGGIHAPVGGEISACDSLALSDFTPLTVTQGLSGTLTADFVMAEGQTYDIAGPLIVPEGKRLLIQPGATLRFAEDAGLDVYGGIYACGAKSPVTFDGAKAQAGSWSGIWLHHAAGTFSHVRILHAADRALALEESSPSLDDVTIADGARFPLSGDGNDFPRLLGEVRFEGNGVQAMEIRGGTLRLGVLRWPKLPFPYVVTGMVKVEANTGLEIPPDVLVTFWHAPKNRVPGLWVEGRLRAEGVTFTSAYDGDWFKDAPAPQPGDWGGLTFAGDAPSELRGVTLRYAGANQAAISLRESSPSLHTVTVDHCAWYPLSADVLSAPDLAELTLADNVPGDALEVRGSVLTGTTRTWGILPGDPQLVRVIRGNVLVQRGAALTINPGVLLKFDHGGKLTVRGTLHAVGGGVESSRIIFTSLYDGDYGGATVSETVKSATGEWGGIVFDGTDSRSILQNSVVRYANVRLVDASPRVRSNIISDVDGAALAATPNSAPDVFGNHLHDNAINGLLLWPGTITADQKWPLVGEPEDQLVRVLGGRVVISAGVTISVEQGVVVKSVPRGVLQVDGGLYTAGRSYSLVLFTSLRDDSGGATVAASTPKPGDWGGLEIGPQANVHVSYTAIRYAEYGLRLMGNAVPVVDEGRLQLSQGLHSLWCQGRQKIPDAFLIEQNESDEDRCPAP